MSILVIPQVVPVAVQVMGLVDDRVIPIGGAVDLLVMPHDFPPWQTVYHYWRQWRIEGRWEQILLRLRRQERKRVGRHPQPTAGIIDSPSLRATDGGGPHGYDGAKKVRGIKRHLLVDTVGTVLAACVSPASVDEHEGARVLLARAALLLPRMGLVWADQGDTGERLASWARRIAEARGGGRAPIRRWVPPHVGAQGPSTAVGTAVRDGSPPVGGGKDVRLAGQVPAHHQGLRVPGSDLRARHLPRDEPEPVTPPDKDPILTLFRHPLAWRN